MSDVYDFERLNVYQEAMDLSYCIYALTKDFPKEELYGIVSQLRRSALSVGLNIAEGKGRYHTKVFIQFLYQARGSLFETIALIKMCCRLELINQDVENEFLDKAASISKKINALIKSMS